MEKSIGLIIFFLLSMAGFSSGSEELNPDGIYCLSYTWIGPDFSVPTDEDGEVVEMKCAEYLIIGNNTNTPCKEPIIYSDDVITRPDPVQLWKTNKTAVACRKSPNHSCAKYTVSFKGLISYETHLCIRVRTKTNIIKSGCLTEKRNNLDIEVCVCESNKGLDFPCNSATTHTIAVLITFLGLCVILLVRL